MKRSEDRILTTHTGSLRRPVQLVQMMVARETGEHVDAAALDAEVRSAVRGIVRAQVDAGIDVVNDGEMSKIGYSTYVRERLSGFSGTETAALGLPSDLAEFPSFAEQWRARMSANPMRRPACTGPIEVADSHAVQVDIANLKAAIEGVPVEDVFMSAASPGVIALFLPNKYYLTHEAYLEAIAKAMKHEYDAIAQAGLVLQLDCPDLAMGRHLQFGTASLEEFRRHASMSVEALNYAVADIPPEQLRIHLCWGNYEGPHQHDVELRDIIDIVMSARPSAISLEACNPRHAHEWQVFENVKLPDGKLLIPGVVDSTNNFIEHPELVALRITQYAQLVGRENVLAGADCGFGTTVTAAKVDQDIVWAKFRAMADGARIASERLWSRQPTPFA